MSKDSKPSDALISYVIPVVVGLILAGIGYLHGLLKINSIIFSMLLIFVIGLAIFLSELLITRASRIAERQQNFRLLSDILFRQPVVSAWQSLSLNEIAALERTASTVWIYAYDLKWEDGNSPLPSAVQENLMRGVSYRYIVPSSSRSGFRVQSLLTRYSIVPNREELIQFRTRTQELKLVQFGVTIYNPSVMSHDHKRTEDCVVVFFPHYEGLASTAFSSPDDKYFLAIRGKSTVEIQEGFVEAWQAAAPFHASREEYPVPVSLDSAPPTPGRKDRRSRNRSDQPPNTGLAADASRPR